MKLYVAGKWEEKARVKAFMQKAIALGATITSDWTAEPEAATKPAQDRAEYLQDCAEAGIDGVIKANAIVVLGHPDLKGGLVEFGMALGYGKTCIIVDRKKCENIFFNACGMRHVDTEEEALELLRRFHTNSKTDFAKAD